MSRATLTRYALVLFSALFCAVSSFADGPPSYNESGSVLSTIDKHGHYYQVATDTKIYLLMCGKVKSFQFGEPECKVGDKPIAAGDTIHFRVDGDWVYMAPVSEGIEEKLHILTTELKIIPPLPPAPDGTNDKNAKTTAESGVVIGTGMQVKGQRAGGWSTTPTAPAPIATASPSTPVVATGPVVAMPTTGGPPVMVTPVGPATGGVVTGVPTTGGAPITAVPVAPVNGVSVAGAPPAGGGMVVGSGAPQWIHILRIQTAGKIYELECSSKPCKAAAGQEIGLGDSLSFRVDKKRAYIGSNATTDGEPSYRILSVSTIAPPQAPAPKPR